MVSTGSLRPPALPTRSRTTDEIPRSTAAQPFAALAARILGRANPRLDGILRAPRRRGGDRLSGRRARLGGEAVSTSRSYDIVIIGSGAGGGTVAQELAPPVRGGGIGRAAWRGRGEISGGAVSFKKKKQDTKARHTRE